MVKALSDDFSQFNVLFNSEVLPLESEERQELLEIDDVMNRLQHIQDAIEDVTAEEESPLS